MTVNPSSSAAAALSEVDVVFDPRLTRRDGSSGKPRDDGSSLTRFVARDVL